MPSNDALNLHNAKRGSSATWLTVTIAFLAVLLDGFDSAALALSVPKLAEQWQVSPASFTISLVLTNLGVVVGYALAGPIGLAVGRKRTLIWSIFLFGLLTIATALTLSVESIALLASLRLVTGIVLGTVLPLSVSMSSDMSRKSMQQAVAVLVTLGVATGGALSGLLGGPLIAHFGAFGVFMFAGSAPIILAVIAAIGLTEPPMAPEAIDTEDPTRTGIIDALFRHGKWSETLLLWAFSFLIFVAAYLLLNWAPTLLLEYGFSATEAPIGLLYVNLGGIIGGFVLVLLSSVIGVSVSLIILPVVGAAALLAFSLLDLPSTMALYVLGIAGAGVIAGQLGQMSLGVSLYEGRHRTTGIGASSALGRIGSVVGPGIAGILLALSVDARSIVLLSLIPVMIAVLCTIVISLRKYRSRRIVTADVV